ncbi:MAG: hypothetical protein AAB967_00760 [Patescibacteria group bacterium]
MSSKYSFLLPGMLGVFSLLLTGAVVFVEVHWWTSYPAMDGIKIAGFLANAALVVLLVTLSGIFFSGAYEEVKKRRN